MWHRAGSVGSVAALAAAAALALTACGGSGAGAAGTTTASANSSPIALSKCMRAHGVSNFPDPSFNGPTVAGKQVNPQTPAFQRAMRECHGGAVRVGSGG